MLEGRSGEQGEVFAYIFFSAGGMGARADRDGLSATAFPSGITGVPAEAIEAVAPILMHRRALLTDSGGPGRYRGGLGQEMELEVVTGHPAVHSPMYDRTRVAARGFAGGRAGTVGAVLHSDGRALHPKRRYTLQPVENASSCASPAAAVSIAPERRDPAAVADDVRQGYVSRAAAEQDYGVVIDAATGEVDAAATTRRRQSFVAGPGGLIREAGSTRRRGCHYGQSYESGSVLCARRGGARCDGGGSSSAGTAVRRPRPPSSSW